MGEAKIGNSLLVWLVNFIKDPSSFVPPEFESFHLLGLKRTSLMLY